MVVKLDLLCWLKARRRIHKGKVIIKTDNHSQPETPVNLTHIPLDFGLNQAATFRTEKINE